MFTNALSPLRRPAQVVMAILLILLLAWVGMFVHLNWVRADHQQRVLANGAWVKKLQLTDLSLFTEARYTRHPTMADRHSAFQDHPLSLEHFPTGSLVAPPEHLRQTP
ncbi:hypothetical protein [Magnetococcus sp. PR-3]|uniref:hypothetical protein n=1 Tax=Magnetococcus sp. PR-3 TaxID=3120355 RepID=UPI002FCE5141